MTLESLFILAFDGLNGSGSERASLLLDYNIIFLLKSSLKAFQKI
jgi:hypothetical protein